MLAPVAMLLSLSAQHIAAFGGQWTDIGDLLVSDHCATLQGMPPTSTDINPSLVRVSDGDYLVARIDCYRMGRRGQMMVSIIALDASQRQVGPTTLLKRDNHPFGEFINSALRRATS